MKKKILFIFLIIFLIIVGLFLAKGNQSFFTKTDTAQMTPPPTLPIAQINTKTGTDGTKKLSFPSFNLSFRIPGDLKTVKQIDPGSEDTQVGSNFVALYTSDTTFDPKNHTQTAGVKLTMNIVKNKKDFTKEEDIIPKTSIKRAAREDSIIPVHNPLLNKESIKVYSFPVDKTASTSAWAYNAEVLFKNGGHGLSITLYCIDYSSDKNSPTCKKILEAMLSTMQL